MLAPGRAAGTSSPGQKTRQSKVLNSSCPDLRPCACCTTRGRSSKVVWRKKRNALYHAYHAYHGPGHLGPQQVSARPAGCWRVQGRGTGFSHLVAHINELPVCSPHTHSSPWLLLSSTLPWPFARQPRASHGSDTGHLSNILSAASSIISERRESHRN